MKTSQIYFVKPDPRGCRNKFAEAAVVIRRIKNGFKIRFYNQDRFLKGTQKVAIGLADNRIYFKPVDNLDVCGYKLLTVNKTSKSQYISVKSDKLASFVRERAYEVILDPECDMYFIEKE